VGEEQLYLVQPIEQLSEIGFSWQQELHVRELPIGASLTYVRPWRRCHPPPSATIWQLDAVDTGVTAARRAGYSCLVARPSAVRPLRWES
jgi:hypothetical protein